MFGPACARAESLLVLERGGDLAMRRSLFEGDTLSFPSGFRLENFSPEKGFAATIMTGTAKRGHDYACALSIAAISEVRFTSEMTWQVTAVSLKDDVLSVSLKNEQFDSRPLELRCSENAPVGEVLAGKGVKLEELRAYESLDQRMPSGS